MHPFRASYASCGEEECTLAAAQTQKWVIDQGDQNMAIVIRLGAAHKASPIIDMEIPYMFVNAHTIPSPECLSCGSKSVDLRSLSDLVSRRF